MTIEELKILRLDLSQSIENLLCDFEKKTGCIIEDIDIIRMSADINNPAGQIINIDIRSYF